MSTIRYRYYSSHHALGGRLWHKFFRRRGIKLFMVFLIPLTVRPISVDAIDWNTVPVIHHGNYQQIVESPAGSSNWQSSFSGPLPFRLRGVISADSEDWLDSTAHYTGTFTPWYLGGQAEIFVQAVNLDGTPWDPDPNTAFNDFGGTSCWMGQNYGNLPWISDPQGSYTDEDWYNELNRLQLWHPDTSGLPPPPAQPVRKGDLVEIRTSVGGLSYNGKMNVNEQHINDPSQDFEVVVLQRAYGLPTPAELTLSNLKNSDNSFIFNPAAPRDSGAEHYQMSRVKLNNVRLTNLLLWGPNMDLKLTDDSGRDIDVHLGLDAGFYSYITPAGTYNVTGVIDQESGNGRDSYRLLALEASNFSALSSVAAPVWNGGGGGDARWSVAANWSTGSIAGRELHFDGNTSLNSNNNFSNDTVFAGLVFNPNAGAFTLSGNAVKVNRVANFSGTGQTIDLSINTGDANCLFLAETGNILVSEPIIGGHGLEKYGSADLTLTAANTYKGTTLIESGLLELSAGGTIDTSSAIQVALGATLEIDGGVHHLGAISGEGHITFSNAAQVTVYSLIGNSLTFGGGCGLTIAHRAGAPYSSNSIQSVPEPSAMLLLIFGLPVLAAYGVFHRK